MVTKFNPPPIQTTRTVTGRPVEDVPESWLARGGSRPEYWIYRALYKLGYKEGVGPGFFRYQAKRFGGRLQKGGAVVDFEIFFPHVGINVQSKYFHNRTSQQRANDALLRVTLEASGFRIEFISEEEAINSPEKAVREAIAGTRRRGPLGT